MVSEETVVVTFDALQASIRYTISLMFLQLASWLAGTYLFYQTNYIKTSPFPHHQAIGAVCSFPLNHV